MPKSIERLTKRALRLEMGAMRDKIRSYLNLSPTEVEEQFRAQFSILNEIPDLEAMRRSLIMSAVYYVENVFNLDG
jgi:hypothetical protein